MHRQYFAVNLNLYTRRNSQDRLRLCIQHWDGTSTISWTLELPSKTSQDVQQIHSQYSCLYWVDQLSEPASPALLHDNSQVQSFLRDKCLYWFEALSLARDIPKGILAVEKLHSLVQVSSVSTGHSFYIDSTKESFSVALKKSPNLTS